MIKRYILTALLLSNLLIFSGCYLGLSSGGYARPEPAPVVYEEPAPPPWAPAHGYRAKYSYRYYPAHSVYYDTGRSLYFYYRDGSWTASVSIPSSIRIDVNSGFVSLAMDTDRPYVYHSDVQKKYPPGQMKKDKKEKGNNGKKDKHKDKYGYRERDRYENSYH
jgi:hypothetical protein